MILVIAPNRRQFDEFVYREKLKEAQARTLGEIVEYRHATTPHQLNGYRGELIVVNADQLPGDTMLLYAEYHDDKHCPVRWVDLD
jgi:hypothetical protein